MLKHKPLSIQIWLIFGFTMVLSIFLMLLVPWFLAYFFSPGAHAFIDQAQENILEDYEHEQVSLEELPYAESTVNRYFPSTLYHMVIYHDGTVVTSNLFPANLMEEIKEEISILEETGVNLVKGSVGEANIYYVARTINDTDNQAYLVTYMWDIYQDEVFQGIFYRLIGMIGLILLLCLFPALLLARYISKPLVKLESHVRSIAERDWHHSIKVNRGDEIGSLAVSIEKMRQRLIQQDQAQQSFLQNISHELKTPVMVIRSYTQSISDGIFPQGNLASTVKVIDEESERLERRIQDLLYLTKIDYLSTHEPANKKTELSAVLEDVVRRLRRRRSELNWSITLSPHEVYGSAEQWTVVFENLLDNQIRYADQQIEVELAEGSNKDGEKTAVIRLWNDGPPIDDKVKSRLFQQFSRGPGGQFGLGLSIVQRLVWLYKGRVWAVNEGGGAAFYVEIPLHVEPQS